MPHEKENKSMVDGIKVKITEKYKRPLRISLPTACLHCAPSSSFSEYDFNYERNVLLKMEEWKRVKKEEAERWEERLKVYSEENEATCSLEQMSLDVSPKSHSVPNTSENCSEAILTPVVVDNHAAPTEKPAHNYINLSEFETDNSSPFDNMELKTINDKEILASVLSSSVGTDSLPKTSNSSEHYYDSNKNGYVWNSYNGYNIPYSSHQYYDPSQSFPNTYGSPTTLYTNQILPMQHSNWMAEANGATYVPSYTTSVPRDGYYRTPLVSSRNIPYNVQDTSNLQAQKSNSRSVPDLVQEINKEPNEKRVLEEYRRKTKTPPPRPSLVSKASMENWKPWPELDSPKHNQRKSFENLDPFVQRLAISISEMGFPESQVIRALNYFNNNDKKVIEFLLQVKRLEEKGQYPVEQIEVALHSNNYDDIQALKHLEASTVLSDLGFPAEKISSILLEVNNDRDAALEKLISLS